MKPLPLLLAMLALTASPSWAANDSREKQMLRRLQQQVQQLDQARLQAEQEKATVLADKDALAREMEKLRSEGDVARRERTMRSRLERELKAAQSELEASRARLADTEKQLAESQAQQRTTMQALVQTESAKKHTETELVDNRQNLKQCLAHNGQLYVIGREMMEKYRDKSCQDALAQVEPFTGLKKVEVENLMETWRDQLDRDRFSVTAKP